MLKAGIIGTGSIAGSHLENLKLLKDRVETACGCDLDENTLERRASEYGFRKYSSYEKMLSEEEPDFVVLCTPQMERKKPILSCVERNIPVFTEKPPAADLASAKEIDAFLIRRDVLVSVGFVFRYMPEINKAIELLKGRQILLLDIQYLCPMMYPDKMRKDFFYRKELSGGLVMDQAIHLLDLIRFLLRDEIDEVQALGANLMQRKTKEITTEESVSMNLRSQKGSLVSYLHTWTHRTWKISMEIFAPSARISIDFTSRILKGLIDGVEITYEPSTSGNMYFEELDAFIKNLSGEGGAILSPYSDSVRTMELADAVLTAVEECETVKL